MRNTRRDQLFFRKPRRADGEIETHRKNFTLMRRTPKEIFFGYVHASYLATAGLKVGDISEAELDTIRAWSAQWMPAAAPLPLEP